MFNIWLILIILYSEDQYKNYIEVLQKLFAKIHVLGKHAASIGSGMKLTF